MTKYWCVNFDSDACLEYGIEKNLWLMQYQYPDDHGHLHQGTKGAIRKNWERLGEITPGDWVVAYLKTNTFYAIAKVITPRRPKTIRDHADTIENYLEQKNSHEHKTGFVYYTPVLYENFSDKWRPPGDSRSRYPQRIDVDQWQKYVPDGISVQGLSKIPLYELQLAVFGIPKSFFDTIAEKLASTPDIKGDGRFALDLTTNSAKTKDEGYFSPGTLQDERKRWLREIVERRGQPEFRSKLIDAYQGRCAVTGCDAVAALEAAHIIPYCGPASDHISNGLLLRADIHTLFDLDLIGIHPRTLTVALGPVLKNTSYSDLNGKRLAVPNSSAARPNTKALDSRWREFLEK